MIRILPAYDVAGADRRENTFVYESRYEINSFYFFSQKIQLKL